MFKTSALAIIVAFCFLPFTASADEIAVGSKAPDFTIPNAKSEQVNLYDLLENGPVVLSFYRGGWCPYCNEQLQAYQGDLDKFDEYNAQLVAISPEQPESANETAMANEVTFQVLSDFNNNVARSYDLIWTVPSDMREKFYGWLESTTGKNLAAYNGIESDELPIPATFVIAQDSTITYMFKNENYKLRAANEEILEALKKLEN